MYSMPLYHRVLRGDGQVESQRAESLYDISPLMLVSQFVRGRWAKKTRWGRRWNPCRPAHHLTVWPDANLHSTTALFTHNRV